MKVFTHAILVLAMIILGIVSMWTTYQSLHDSILPAPVVPIRFSETVVWDCSIFALGLSVAIGLMLYALKLAIIDEQKRLNLFGVLGLTVIAFISITFNMDVLYRTANKSFFLNYSTSRVKSQYENYLAEIQHTMVQKRDDLLKKVARQEGELDAEVKGLREAPAGYGAIAKDEDYRLTLLQKETAVELETVQAALVKKQEADALLASSTPASLDEVQKLEHELRVLVKDVGAVTGKRLPETVELESPFFAVFRKLFDWKQIGFEEIFFVILAFLLDLGDIIGYSLVPAARKKPQLAPIGDLPEFLKAVPATVPATLATLPPQPEYAPLLEDPGDEPPSDGTTSESPQDAAEDSQRARRPIHFRHR